MIEFRDKNKNFPARPNTLSEIFTNTSSEVNKTNKGEKFSTA